MSGNTSEGAIERKRAIRKEANAARDALAIKDELSQAIHERLVSLPEYQKARTIMYYVDVRGEVRTRPFLPGVLGHDKRIVVPYCVDGELALFLLRDMSQLAKGMYQILEPKPELRDLAENKIAVRDLDLIVVPGVAFDRNGGRVGHGLGYYDKLLQHARRDTPLVGLAFECQMFPDIPAAANDIIMDKVVTEAAVYAGKGRIV